MPINLNEELRPGTMLATLKGDRVKVISTISREGGQGDVYRASMNGKDYALKWYGKSETDVIGSEQYKNIKKLTERYDLLRRENRLAMLKRFIWPQIIVTESGREDNGRFFGYVMELIPAGYHELKDFLKGDDVEGFVRFKSFHAMIWAGLHLVSAIRDLHTEGMSYKDLNPGNASFNPETGHCLMVDCDNISVDNEPSTVAGMHGYMAPEIVRSGMRRPPDIQSDQFSEAILLYQMFYFNHPFEGKLWGRFDMHDEKTEALLYSIHPVYNMAKDNDTNRPGDGWAPSVISRMKKLPPVLLDGFETTFVRGVDHSMSRTTELSWLGYLTAARDQMVFLDAERTKEQCVRFNVPSSIPMGCLRLTVKPMCAELAVYPMQSIFKNTINGDHTQFDRRVGWVALQNRRLVIQNLSGETWVVFDPASQKDVPVANNQWFPVMPGTRVTFSEKPTKIVGVFDDPRASAKRSQ